jgi:hypothetical protein
LIQVLQSSGNPPQIVVMSACYSATGNAEQKYVTGGDVDSPLAMALVKGKIPVAVGMAGKVADQACRLFTQRFYQSLLEGADIAQAAAEGRRAGIIATGGTDPKSSVDWALPTVFLSEGVEEARLTIKDRELEQDWHGIAAHYATPGYPAFCDRLELFQLYDLLMADEAIASRKWEGGLEVLAISVSQADIAAGVEGHRYGCSWVLRELAAQAVLDGHVPILVNDDVLRGKECPKTHQELIPVIVRAGLTTKQYFNQAIEERTGDDVKTGFGAAAKLKWIAAQLKLLTDIEGGASADALHADVKEIYDSANSAADPGVVARAVRTDLLSLLEEVKTLRPEKERQKTKLLLLVDNIHRMDAAADALLNHLMGPLGIRGKRKQIRVIFTYSTVPAPGQEQAVNDIKKWLENANYAEPVPLQKFKRPLEELMAYEQFLLRWEDNKVRKPLAVRLQADQQFVDSFFGALCREVDGIPSNLKIAASPIVRVFYDLKILREANDEDQLKFIREQKRGN